MRNIVVKPRKNAFILKIFTATIFAVIAVAASVIISGGTFKNAAAAGADQTLLPNKSEEYYNLSHPIHAYSDDEITAVTENNKLIIFTENGTVVKDGLTSLKQVSRLGDFLIYTDNASIYKLPVSNPSAAPVALTDSVGNPVNGTFFDTNGRYLVTVFSTNIQVYDATTDPFVKDAEKTVSGVQENPVAVNSDAMFYVAGGKICKRAFSAFNGTVEYSAVLPSAMIADDEFIYYAAGSEIYRLAVNDTSLAPQALSVADCPYDLGKFASPSGLSFRNGNLFITDGGTNGSVQEFSVSENGLVFTGYAIASGLSAYNRVAVSATRIDRYGKYVAALDDFKLTVINTENFDGYAPENIVNKFVGNVPSRFALGNGTVILCRGDKVLGANLDGDEETEILSDITALDVCYQSGFYYAAYTNGAKTTVVKIDEKTMTEVGTTEFDAAATVVTADVFGNVFVADGAKIYKRVIADGTTETIDITGVKKLSTDLAGNLFALANGKISTYDAAANSWTVAFETATDVKSFGMNFDLKTVNILLEGDQAVYAYDTLDNAALSEFAPNADFTQATTRKTALKAYVAGDNANIYSVTAENGAFAFNGLIDKAAEYPLLAEITVVAHADLTLYALASEQGVVLINANDLNEKPVDFSDAPERVFAITSVYAYALPVIERGGIFAIETDGGKIRLEKGAEIRPENRFEILGKKFYSATVSVNGVTIDCYIPVDFTAEITSGSFRFDKYSLEKLKATSLYEFSDLTGEILTVENGETVKLLGSENGALKVAITRGSETVIGFVPANALTSDPNTIVRNVLIILAVLGSLAGTVSYFLLRRKR